MVAAWGYIHMMDFLGGWRRGCLVYLWRLVGAVSHLGDLTKLQNYFVPVNQEGSILLQDYCSVMEVLDGEHPQGAVMAGVPGRIITSSLSPCGLLPGSGWPFSQDVLCENPAAISCVK